MFGICGILLHKYSKEYIMTCVYHKSIIMIDEMYELNNNEGCLYIIKQLR